MRHGHLCAARPSLEIRVHHLPHDRTGADDRDLNDDVVEAGRAHPRQGRHLRARLDLEDADGVRGLEQSVDAGIAGRELRQIHLDAFVRPDQRQRLLEDGHHAQPEQVDFNDAEVGAVVLVPLHDHAAGHRGGLERHDLVEAPRGDDHAARVLAEVARQPRDLLAESEIKPDAAIVFREPRFGGAVLQRVEVGGELEVRQQPREAIELGLRQAQDLSDLSRRRAGAVGDHVGGHRGAARAELRVDVLDDLLALGAAGQVEVDVGPGLVAVHVRPLFAEEALEEQAHAHRVDGGDAQRVADGAVRRRPAALREDLLLQAEEDQVVDDEEVAGEAELRDQVQFALELRDRLRPARAVRSAVPLARALERAVPQLAVERGGEAQARIGKPVIEISQRVGAALGDAPRVRDRFGEIPEEPGEVARGADVALGVAAQGAAGAVEGDAFADAGERVVERLSLRGGVVDAAACDERDAPGVPGVDAAAVLALLARVEVALHFGVEASGAQRRGQRDELRGRAGGDRDEAVAEVCQLLERNPALALLAALVAEREQPAEVLVALPVLAEERERAGAFDVQLGADDGPEPCLLRGLVKARRAVEAAHVGEAEGRVSRFGGGGGEVLGQGRGAQEGERRAGMQLDVVASHRPPRSTTRPSRARARCAGAARPRAPDPRSRATRARPSTTRRSSARAPRSTPRVRPARLRR